MIALDTNFLVCTHRLDSPLHEQAYAMAQDLMQSGRTWSIPNPGISEFLNIVTHPKIYEKPTPVVKALDQIDAWLESLTGHILHSSHNFRPLLRQLAQDTQLRGTKYHDARIAAVGMENSVTVLWTIDRDFGRYKQLKAINPLV